MVASLPITVAATIMTDSGITGLILPCMIVWMNRLTVDDLSSAVGDHFIGVHVCRRARVGLKNVDGEMPVVLPFGNFR